MNTEQAQAILKLAEAAGIDITPEEAEREYPLPNGAAYGKWDKNENLINEEYVGKITMISGDEHPMVIMDGPMKPTGSHRRTLKLLVIDQEEIIEEVVMDQGKSTTPRAPKFRGVFSDGIAICAYLNRTPKNKPCWGISKDELIDTDDRVITHAFKSYK